jgi:hypothetical protein
MRDVEQRVVIDAHIQLWLDHGSATAAEAELLALRCLGDHSSGGGKKRNQPKTQQDCGRSGAPAAVQRLSAWSRLGGWRRARAGGKLCAPLL